MIRELFKQIGTSIFITLMFPVMVIHMAIKPDDWEEFFDDPLEDEFFK